MVFLNPLALFWLLAAIPLALLYWGWRARRTAEVSHLPLWREALAQRSAWSRWRPFVSYGAWLTLLVLLAAALAEPLLGTGAGRPRSVVVIVDATAGMNVLHEGESRLEAAQRRAWEFLSQLGPLEEARIVSWGADLRRHGGWTRDRGAWRRSLAEIRASDTSGDPLAAVDLAERLLASRENGRIVLFSDFAFPEAGALAGRELVRRVAVGEPVGNVGIVGFSARPALDAPHTHDLLLRVQSKGIRYPRRELSITRLEGVVETVKLEFDEFGAATWRGRLSGAGLVTAQLAPADEFPADDSASLVLEERRPRVVAWRGPREHAALHLLRSMPDVQVLEEPSAGREGVEWEVHVGAPTAAARGRFLWLDPRGELGGVVAGEGVEVLGGRIESALESQGIDLAEAAIERARRLTAPPDWEVLARAPEGVALVARSRGPGGGAVVNVDLERSDFTRHPVFPRLLRYLLNEAAPSDAPLESLRTTDLLAWSSEREEERLFDPHGRDRTGRGAEQLLDRAGIWRVAPAESFDKPTSLLLVNLLSPRESDLRPLAASSEPELEAPPLSSYPIWPLLVFAAMVAVCCEWAAFTCRITD